MGKPKIKWIKNSIKEPWFEDGSKFLIALQVSKKQAVSEWEFAIVETRCDGEGMELFTVNGDYYSDWTWPDVEYFKLLEGQMPCERRDRHDYD